MCMYFYLIRVAAYNQLTGHWLSVYYAGTLPSLELSLLHQKIFRNWQLLPTVIRDLCSWGQSQHNLQTNVCVDETL